MTDIGSDVFAYGLAAGLSGTAFLATVLVLATERGPTNAGAFLVGFAGVLGAAVLGAVLAADLVTGAGGQQRVATLVKLLLGVLLLSAAWRVHPGRTDGLDISAKVAGMTAKLQHLEPASALRVGVGLAVLPKRLAITLLAGAAIGASGASGASVGQGLALTALYILTATGLIWITLLVYLLGGQRAASGLDAARRWVVTNATTLAFVVTLLFGVLFTGQAIVELLA